LTLRGQFYNEGTITSAAGTSVNLIGDSLVAGQPGWTNFGPTNSPGTIQVAGTLGFGGAWSNDAGGPPITPGTIQVAGGTLNLGGSFHTADIGAITRSGGTIAITGALDNTGATFALDDTTGSWNMASGSITGGTVQATGSAQFLQPLGGFTQDTITAFNGTWTMLGGNGETTLAVRGDLNLNGTIFLNGSGSLVFAGPAGTTQNINSIGTAVIRVADTPNTNRTAFLTQSTDSGTGSTARTVVINPGVTVQGSGGSGSFAQVGDVGQIWVNQGTITAAASGANLTLCGQFSNEGTITSAAGTSVNLAGSWTNDAGAQIVADGGTVALNGSWTNSGVLQDVDQGVLSINSSGSINGNGILDVSSSSTATIGGSLQGNTQDADRFTSSGTVSFNGAGTAAAPQLLEAMGQDLGSNSRLAVFALKTAIPAEPIL